MSASCCKKHSCLRPLYKGLWVFYAVLRCSGLQGRGRQLAALSDKLALVSGLRFRAVTHTEHTSREGTAMPNRNTSPRQ